MFNKRFAFGYEGEPQNEWGGEWHGRHEHGQHGHGPHGPFFMGRRGFFGPGGPFGPEGPFQDGGRRYFGRGDVKFALLELLQERPMHGYEMMKALEERSGGFYAPSAGTIYPTLQLLEDRSLVTVQELEGKKIYSITDAGRAFLGERQERHGGHQKGDDVPPWERGFQAGRRWWHEPEAQAMRSEAMEVARLFTIATRKSFQDQEKLAQLRDIMSRTRKELSDLIYEAPNTTGTSGTTPPNTETNPGTNTAE